MSRNRAIRRLRRKHARAAAGSKREAAAKRRLDALLAKDPPAPDPKPVKTRWGDSVEPVRIRIAYISPQGTLKGKGLPRTRLARKRMELPKRIEGSS